MTTPDVVSILTKEEIQQKIIDIAGVISGITREKSCFLSAF